LAWKDFVKRNIRWLVGVFVWTIATRYFDQLWSLFESVIYRLPFPSNETIILGLVGVGTIIVGSILIASDVASRIKSHQRTRAKTQTPSQEIKPSETNPTGPSKAIEPHPSVLVTLADDITSRIRRLCVRLSDGERWCDGYFCFITIKNVDGPSIKELEIHYQTTVADLGKGELMLITPTQKGHITVTDFSDTVEAFDKRKDAIRLALLNGYDSERRTVLHQDEFGKTFLLFFTLKGYPTVCIPAAESSRMYEEIPCKWHVGLSFSGDPMPAYQIASFYVAIESWDKVTVVSPKPRQPDSTMTLFPTAVEWLAERARAVSIHNQSRLENITDQMRRVYEPLESAVLQMKGGKDTLPVWVGLVGNYHNAWTDNPKVINLVVDVFTEHLVLIESKEVRKGWEENKDVLRKGEFWYGERQYRWLEAIEREYDRLKLERTLL